MAKQTRARRILTFTGAAALMAVAMNLIISVINAHKEKRVRKRALPGSHVCVNLSASEIYQLTDLIIAKSNEMHDLVASVPLEKVTYTNTVAHLVDLEESQYPLVQSCLFPKMVATSDEVRKASSDAERRLDSHFLMCRVLKLIVNKLCKARCFMVRCWVPCAVKWCSACDTWDG